MEESVEQKRLDHLDAVRAVAVLLVLFGHSIRPSMRTEFRWCEVAYQFVYQFHVSLLFLISGLCFQQGSSARKAQSLWNSLAARSHRILRPWLSYSLLLYGAFALVQAIPFCRDLLMAGGYRLLSPWEYVLALLKNENPYGFHLWYLQTLFLFTALGLLLEKIFPAAFAYRVQLALLLLAPGVYQLFCQEWCWALKGFFQKLPCFLLGCVLPQSLLPRQAKRLAAIGAVCGLAILWQCLFPQHFPSGDTLFMAYGTQLVQAGVCLGILAVCFLLRSHLQPLARFGRSTLVYYLYHQPLCGAFLGLILYDKLGLAPAVVCAVCMAASLLVPHFVCRAAEHLQLAPVLSRLGLPMEKED